MTLSSRSMGKHSQDQLRESLSYRICQWIIEEKFRTFTYDTVIEIEGELQQLTKYVDREAIAFVNVDMNQK